MDRVLALVLLIAPLLSGCAAKRRSLDEVSCTVDVSASSESGEPIYIEANSQTVHWGYSYEGLEPVAYISSEDEIMVEMITHHAGDDYDKLIKGDPGMEDIYNWTSSGMNVPMRGASGKGDGVHILTGPIYVCGAEPGDVLQVDILDLSPRVNPATNKSYGVNAAAWWGFHFRAGFKDDDPREVITVYEIETDGDGWVAVPDYQFRFSDASVGYVGPVSPSCTPTSGSIPRPADNASNFEWNNAEFSGYPGAPGAVECVDGQQTWDGIYYPGLITQHPTGTEVYDIRGKFRVPVNLHIGNMGLAPSYPHPVDSVPPMVTGGNLDDKRIGIGATMFYPVQVEGGMLTMGDAHTAQGDSELDGTGIETSVNGHFRVTLHKAGALPPKVQDLNFALLENEEEYVVHGHAYIDYIEELGTDGSVYSKGADLDMAMQNTYRLTRNFMMNTFNMTEDQAITAMTVAVDFSITQVVDGNWGIMAIIPKAVFEPED